MFSNILKQFNRKIKNKKFTILQILLYVFQLSTVFYKSYRLLLNDSLYYIKCNINCFFSDYSLLYAKHFICKNTWTLTLFLIALSRSLTEFPLYVRNFLRSARWKKIYIRHAKIHIWINMNLNIFHFTRLKTFYSIFL